MGTTARDLMDSEDQPKATKPRRQLLQEAAAAVIGTTAGAAPRCRVCAAALQRREHAARIFGEEGRRRNLQAHIQKYLHVAVSSEDKLPKMVCASCIGKLDGIHAFATLAQRSQEKLRQELLRRPDSGVIVDNSSNSDSSTNKLGDRSLLHSILTKGSAEASSNGKMSQRRQRTPSTEEMEVKVDPMLFLQCALEQPTSVDCSDYSDDSDRDTSSYCSPDSEPLSLTNKAPENPESRTEEELDSQRKLELESEQADNEEANESCEEDEEFDEVEEGSSRSHCCKLCNRAFASQIGLQNHLWSHLSAAEPRDRGQAAQAHRQHHRRPAAAASPNNSSCSENNGLLAGGSFICPICGKRISTKGNLKVHLETHRPKGKYGCDICGRIFKTQSNLFRHKEYHSGVQFPCSVCGRVYPTNSTLRAHSITHSDLRPHACPLCDKTFKRNQDLKFHINQHTGARPYQCPYCPKAFASSGNCFSHRKRMHPKEVHRDRQRAADLMR